MSGALMNKVWDLFGMDSAEPDEYEEEDVYDYGEDEEEIEDRKLFGRKNNNNNKIVNMPQTQTQGQAIKMVISQPTTFEQSDEICSFLKEKKSVIVNLEYVNKDVARRIVDFIIREDQVNSAFIMACIDNQVQSHDYSKYSIEEWEAYRKNFNPVNQQEKEDNLFVHFLYQFPDKMLRFSLIL